MDDPTFDQFFQKELVVAIDKYISTFTSQFQAVYQYRMKNGETLKAVGIRLGVSANYIKIVEYTILRRIRNNLKIIRETMYMARN